MSRSITCTRSIRRFTRRRSSSWHGSANALSIVEPAPPSDLFGKRIAELYSRAKYEAGAFEEYQPVEYWRKLLAIVKGEVWLQQFTFTRIAPRFLISDTIDLILDAMAISDMPQPYIDELRDLARRTDTQLSPLSRYVLVAVAGGEQPRSKAGTQFREVDDLAPPVPPASHPVDRRLPLLPSLRQPRPHPPQRPRQRWMVPNSHR